jgi:hypothetical protein
VFITSVNYTIEKRYIIVGAFVTGDTSMTPRINLLPVTMTPAIIDRRLPFKRHENTKLNIFAAAKAGLFNSV